MKVVSWGRKRYSETKMVTVGISNLGPLSAALRHIRYVRAEKTVFDEMQLN